MSIARAILKNAPILLCDGVLLPALALSCRRLTDIFHVLPPFPEPTSSLDGETETEIMNNLKQIGTDRTTIIVAHRLSTVQDCDKIIVMDKGQVVEEGRHEELAAMGGRYTELLRMQESEDDKLPSQ